MLTLACMARCCDAALLIGEAAPALAEAIGDACEVVQAETLDAAVAIAARRARAGTSVLLAPACASFDQFADYRARGEAFALAVRREVGS